MNKFVKLTFEPKKKVSFSINDKDDFETVINEISENNLFNKYDISLEFKTANFDVPNCVVIGF